MLYTAVNATASTLLHMTHVNLSYRNKQQAISLVCPRNIQVARWLQFSLILSHPLKLEASNDKKKKNAVSLEADNN